LRLKAFFAGIVLLLLLGCLPTPPKEPFRPEEPFPFQEVKFIPCLTDDADKSSLQIALEKSLEHLSKKISPGSSPSTVSGPFGIFFTPQRVYRSLALFREILLSASDEVEFEKRVREAFVFWEVRGNILLTGYYEPLLEGNLEPGGEYQYPIYRRPDDLSSPYYSRRDIDCLKVLQGKGYEVAWLKDPWGRFVLHVQGSGQIRLPNGEVLRVGFAASNGRPYRSIGRVLVERGFLGENELSLRRVREFLQQHPELIEETFNANERYVFFRFIQGNEGPIGALAFPLTAGRSVATDHTIFPPGTLAYLVTQQPVFHEAGKLRSRRTLRRFVLNQDTGAAMKGPGRVDLFFGSGEQAGMAAGEMREEGKIYFLLAK